uniref:Uncharacterized protein n=1 Tax=Oryza punctata TaxID=4537 RepID=A0A0E0M4Q8_ORYPU
MSDDVLPDSTARQALLRRAPSPSPVMCSLTEQREKKRKGRRSEKKLDTVGGFPKKSPTLLRSPSDSDSDPDLSPPPSSGRS